MRAAYRHHPLLHVTAISLVLLAGARRATAGAYTEKHETWTASSAATWEVKDLSGAPYNVPANAVVEMAVMNYHDSDTRSAGMRAVGSSLERRGGVQDADGENGVDVIVMHVQADASSRIEQYAQDTTDVEFVLLGYWEGVVYVERFDSFTAGANTSWQDQNLNTYGVTGDQVVEILMANSHTSNGREIGVRTDGSSLNSRRLDVAPDNDPPVWVSMHAVAAGGNATIEVYAQNDADVTFYLAGYWTVPPGSYTELDDTTGDPSGNDSWDDVSLGGFGVPANAVAEISLGQGETSGANRMGARAKGSSNNNRHYNLKEGEGGYVYGRMNALADSNAEIQLFHDDVSQDHEYRLVGYWDLAGAPTMSSAANQAFFVGDALTAMSTVTVTDASTASITAGNDIRLRIPAGFNMTWNSADTSATIGGAASSKVASTVSYEDSNATLVLNVTSSFADSDVITVAGLSFTSFTGKSSAATLQLEINNDDVVTATDDKTIFIGAPTYRSIGTDVGDRYSVGDASTTAGSAIVTFAGGASLPADVGIGDKLTIGGVSPIAFDNVTAQTFGNASSHNLNHAIGGGGERVLIVMTSHETNPPRTITGVTYDGQALAFAGAQEASSTTRLRVEMWYLLEANLPAAGTYQTTVNWSGSARPGIAVLSLDGVAQQAPEATSSSNCSDCTTISTNITTLTDGAWVVSNVGNGESGTYTGHGSGQVERWDQNPNSAVHSGTTRSVATAGLVSISETASGQANRQAHFVAAFAPAFVPDLYILSRDSATEVTVQQNATSSLSNQTYRIERAYYTMQSWEEDRQGDLVAGTRREVGVCYNDGVFTDRLVISGSTTDVKYYMALTVAAGERHNGVRNSGARIDAGGGFSPSQNAINVEDEYTRIEWLEITDVVDGRDAIFLDDDPAADNSTVAGVFVHGFWQISNAAFRVAADNITIRNCFATGGTTYAVRIESTGSVMIENCTFWGSSGGGYGVYGVAGSDVGVRNTISVDHGTLDMYIGTGGGATISYYGYNLFITYGGGFDPNDSAYAGNNQVPPVNLERLFADLSTSDLHLELTGHRAGNRGRDLSSSFTGDIDGTTRTVTWDIGADEGVPGTAPLPPRIVRWAEVEP